MNYSTQDKKIKEFDIDRGYDEFVNIFTDEEINNMYNWIKEKCCGYEEREKGMIVNDYVIEKLIDNIRDFMKHEVIELFDIFINVI